jgi:pimeloyl-ACP methyl ester carboxylesterase
MQKNKKNIYILSGLGADKRVFEKIDFSKYLTTFIHWQTPEKNESIENYASKLLQQITTPKPVIIGLSFGGIIAIELAKQIETEKVILLSSAKTTHEIPFYFRLAGKLNLNKIIPLGFLKTSNFVTNWFFGVNSPYEQRLLNQILKDTDIVFLNWAIDKILNWNNRIKISNAIHVHGTHDKILPFYFVKSDISIKHGGHFMTLNKAEELSSVINKIIG